jgi:Family of unknown function (DUF6200)
MAEETVRGTSGEEKPAGTGERESRGERREERKARDKEAARKAEAVVIDLGRKSRKDVRDLRKGRGRLMDDVEDAIEELREAGAISATVQPVIVVVERRLAEREGMVPLFFPPGIPAMLPFGLERDDDDDDEDEDDD